MTRITLSYPFAANLLPKTSPIPAKSVTSFSPIGSEMKLLCFCEVVDIVGLVLFQTVGEQVSRNRRNNEN